jgi:hypothetical protein
MPLLCREYKPILFFGAFCSLCFTGCPATGPAPIEPGTVTLSAANAVRLMANGLEGR